MGGLAKATLVGADGVDTRGLAVIGVEVAVIEMIQWVQLRELSITQSKDRLTGITCSTSGAVLRHETTGDDDESGAVIVL